MNPKLLLPHSDFVPNYWKRPFILKKLGSLLPILLSKLPPVLSLQPILFFQSASVSLAYLKKFDYTLNLSHFFTNAMHSLPKSLTDLSLGLVFLYTREGIYCESEGKKKQLLRPNQAKTLKAQECEQKSPTHGRHTPAKKVSRLYKFRLVSCA